MGIDLKTYFEEIERDDYQRENFDDFLKKVKFSYSIPSIHIAGSNGKGSTANYLARVYNAHALKVGLFISPALNKVNEMISINGVEISDDDFIKMIEENEKLFEKYALSPFEIQTFIALSYFEKNKCDIAIIECGMGGEIDATNIFTPILSIITSISVEHTYALGVSLSEIALHKAGIIKHKVPVLIGDIKGDALDVIVNKAKYTKSNIYSIRPYNNDRIVEGGYEFGYPPYSNLKIKTLALSGVYDACIAIEATNILKDILPLSEEELKKGLYTDRLVGRFEIHPGQPTIVIDGAHNPEAVTKLRLDMENVFRNRAIHVVFACFRDKNITTMLPEIALLGDLNLTTFNHSRAREEADYFLYLEDYKFFNDHIELIKSLKQQYPEDVILVAGSLAFACLVHKELLDEKI